MNRTKEKGRLRGQFPLLRLGVWRPSEEGSSQPVTQAPTKPVYLICRVAGNRSVLSLNIGVDAAVFGMPYRRYRMARDAIRRWLPSSLHWGHLVDPPSCVQRQAATRLHHRRWYQA